MIRIQAYCIRRSTIYFITASLLTQFAWFHSCWVLAVLGRFYIMMKHNIRKSKHLTKNNLRKNFFRSRISASRFCDCNTPFSWPLNTNTATFCVFLLNCFFPFQMCSPVVGVVSCPIDGSHFASNAKNHQKKSNASCHLLNHGDQSISWQEIW